MALSIEDGDWVPLFRRVRKHDLWQDKPFADGQAWLDLVMRANHRESKFPFRNQPPLTVRPRQLVATYAGLAEDWGWGRSRVRRFLARLAEPQKGGVSADTPDRMIILEHRSFDGKTATWTDTKTDSGLLLLTVVNLPLRSDSQRGDTGGKTGERAGDGQDADRRSPDRGHIQEEIRKEPEKGGDRRASTRVDARVYGDPDAPPLEAAPEGDLGGEEQAEEAAHAGENDAPHAPADAVAHTEPPAISGRDQDSTAELAGEVYRETDNSIELDTCVRHIKGAIANGVPITAICKAMAPEVLAKAGKPKLWKILDELRRDHNWAAKFNGHKLAPAAPKGPTMQETWDRQRAQREKADAALAALDPATREAWTQEAAADLERTKVPHELRPKAMQAALRARMTKKLEAEEF